MEYKIVDYERKMDAQEKSPELAQKFGDFISLLDDNRFKNIDPFNKPETKLQVAHKLVFTGGAHCSV